MIERLVTIRTYSRLKNVTTECVRQWGEKGKIPIVIIDGVKFVRLTDEESEIMNNQGWRE